MNRTLRAADDVAATVAVPETPGLYRQQIALPPKQFAQFGPRYLAAGPVTSFVFAQPHGDFIMGNPPPRQNLNGQFRLAAPARVQPTVVVTPQRVPTTALALWFGAESGLAWPISSYGDEPIPDDEFSEGAEPPLPGPTFVPPVARVSLGSTSASYDIQLHRAPSVTEIAVAGTALAQPVPLLADPHVTLDYDSPDPEMVRAWLRFVLRRFDGKTIYLDKALDADGLLDDWSLRDAAQTALDRRFEETLSLHQTDPRWVAEQPYFNPEQAESYRLEGVRLLYGKAPNVDMRLNPASFSVVLRSLRISLHGGPWRSFLDRGPTADFGDRDRTVETNLSRPTETSRDGALVVGAVVREESAGLSRNLVGRSVTMRLQDGSALTGDVLRDAADGYLLQIDETHRRLISKSGVAAILSSAPPHFRWYAATLPLRGVDLQRFPTVHLRYWQGSSNLTPDVSFRVETPSGPRDVRVTAGAVDPESSAPLPAQWIAQGDFPGFDPPLTLDGFAASPPADTGWREAVFDLRALAAARTGSLQVTPLAVTVRMSMQAGVEGSVSEYAFGFGDVQFSGEQRGEVGPPRDAALSLDGRRVLPASRSVAGDVVTLRYPALDLSAGRHALSTDVEAPWQVASASLREPQPPRPVPPPVTVRHIDDELFALHVDGNDAAWLEWAESFHTGWRLIPGAAPRDRLSWLLSFRWLGAPVTDHIVGNGFGNAWRLGSGWPARFRPRLRPAESRADRRSGLGARGARRAGRWRRRRGGGSEARAPRRAVAAVVAAGGARRDGDPRSARAHLRRLDAPREPLFHRVLRAARRRAPALRHRPAADRAVDGVRRACARRGRLGSGAGGRERRDRAGAARRDRDAAPGRRAAAPPQPRRPSASRSPGRRRRALDLRGVRRRPARLARSARGRGRGGGTARSERARRHADRGRLEAGRRCRRRPGLERRVLRRDAASRTTGCSVTTVSSSGPGSVSHGPGSPTRRC